MSAALLVPAAAFFVALLRHRPLSAELVFNFALAAAVPCVAPLVTVTDGWHAAKQLAVYTVGMSAYFTLLDVDVFGGPCRLAPFLPRETLGAHPLFRCWAPTVVLAWALLSLVW